MNLIKHHIVEVISEEKNTDYGGINSVVKVDCCGGVRINNHYCYSEEQWEMEKKQGYYMA